MTKNHQSFGKVFQDPGVPNRRIDKIPHHDQGHRHFQAFFRGIIQTQAQAAQLKGLVWSTMALHRLMFVRFVRITT